MSSFVPSAINLPFSELQTPDFAWKFLFFKILTKFWKTKWPPNYNIEQNSLISWAMDNLNKFWEKQNGPQITKLSWYEQGRLLSSQACEIFIWKFFKFLLLLLLFQKKSRKLARIADASVNIILILWFGGHFVFQNFVHTNFHAKSGLCSTGNERVMLNFAIWRSFCF